MPPHPPPLRAEDVAYWYLRLNGFLTIENFLVHGDRGGDSRTDIDVLGVRFRYRREHLADPMRDDDWIEHSDATIVVFCEVTREAKDFNEAWSRRERKIMESFLALVGILPEETRADVTRDLYEHGMSRSAEGFLITTLLMHHDPFNRVRSRWPRAKMIQLRRALEFIHDRFGRYSRIKSDHGQWRPSGHCLWETFKRYRNDRGDFVRSILGEIGV